MKMKRSLKRLALALVFAVLIIPVAIVGMQLVSDPGSDMASVAPPDAAQQVEHGKYLALAGNCMGCHTARGGQAYAGGRAISTSFGNLYTSNITPDAHTGIGTWSADDFWRALHNGKSKDGHFLYPAFPYPNYTRVTRPDADALYAYLRTLKPVRQPNREHALRFPYNQRILLAFWRALYFTPGQLPNAPTQSAKFNRGAYLVEGLGHCSSCHTARDTLGGPRLGSELAGATIPMRNWYASSLTSDEVTGLGSWTEEDIADLLKTGVSHRGTASGPMAEVVASSLQHLDQPDIAAMATYLKTMPKTAASDTVAIVRTPGNMAAILKQGANLYKKHCVECHRADGKGIPPAYPPLAGNPSLAGHSTLNALRMVLNGGYPPSTGGNPRPYGMPPFGVRLDDGEIAAVVTYIRSSWGNNGGAVSPLEVSRSRGAPAE